MENDRSAYIQINLTVRTDVLPVNAFFSYSEDERLLLHRMLGHDRQLLKKAEEAVFRKVNIPHDATHSLAIETTSVDPCGEWTTLCISGTLHPGPAYFDLIVLTCAWVDERKPLVLNAWVDYKGGASYSWTYDHRTGWDTSGTGVVFKQENVDGKKE